MSVFLSREEKKNLEMSLFFKTVSSLQLENKEKLAHAIIMGRVIPFQRLTFAVTYNTPHLYEVAIGQTDLVDLLFKEGKVATRNRKEVVHHVIKESLSSAIVYINDNYHEFGYIFDEVQYRTNLQDMFRAIAFIDGVELPLVEVEGITHKQLEKKVLSPAVIPLTQELIEKSDKKLILYGISELYNHIKLCNYLQVEDKNLLTLIERVNKITTSLHNKVIEGSDYLR